MTDAERIEALELQVFALQTAIYGLMNSDLRNLLTAAKISRGEPQAIEEGTEALEKTQDLIRLALDNAFGDAPDE